jgi:predicted GIY-YIG superfamily endonuclease
MNGPHFVYRYFGTQDEVLYIGVTKNPRQRFSEHARTPWGREKERITTVAFAIREDAEREERRAIAEEHPKYNQWCNPGYTWETDFRREHRAGEGRPGRRTKPQEPK